METETYRPAAPENELEVVLADYLRAVESGQRPNRPRLLDSHPHLAAELRGFLANHDWMERWVAPLRPAAPSPKTQVFGPYELLAEIARGGMGVVYRARRIGSGRLVALKRMRTELALPPDVERFRSEAEAASALDHPNIVPIYEVGEHDGQPYFSMKLIDGGTLAQHFDEFRLPLLDRRTGKDAAGKTWSRAEIVARKRKIVALMAAVARAVQHAHQRRIIHRDLKPANILLASGGRKPPEAPSGGLRPPLGEYTPMITDFGLAKRVEEDLGLTLSSVVVGTPSYMAPEQAACEKVLTTAVDIWSLGALFYELLTGRPPFVGRNAQDIFRQLQEREPEPPSTINPLVDRDLDAICMKCLEKEPAQRYGSAERLAVHLELWLAGETVPVRRPGRGERLLRWCRRHPLAAATTGAAGVLLVLVTLAAVALARDREARLRDEILRQNKEMARHVASTVLVHLERLSVAVEKTAEHPELLQCLERKDRRGLEQFIAQVHREFDEPKSGYRQPNEESPFKSWYVLDTEGNILAVSPNNPKILAERFAGRDYFQGALRHGGQSGRSAVHVSRIYLARNDNYYKFALSAPVRDKDGRLLGVLATTIPTSSTIGSLRLPSERRIAVLVGRQDTNPQEEPAATEPPVRHLILLHPAYHKPGEVALEIASPALEKVRPRRHDPLEELRPPGPEATAATDEQYVDSVGAALEPAYAGRWLAGLAPVGNTEFVVIVQQRYDEAIGTDRTVTLALLLLGGVALALAVFLVGALIRYGVQRRRLAV
jgi:serine/threonine-protein kinase